MAQDVQNGKHRVRLYGPATNIEQVQAFASQRTDNMPSELVGLNMLKMRSGKLTRVTIESVKLPEQFVVENNTKGFFRIKCT
jgi:hypothetical protein